LRVTFAFGFFGNLQIARCNTKNISL